MTETTPDDPAIGVIDEEGFDEFGVRWDCVEKARELLLAEGPFTRASVDEVLALAKRIERYITTGEVDGG